MATKNENPEKSTYSMEHICLRRKKKLGLTFRAKLLQLIPMHNIYIHAHTNTYSFTFRNKWNCKQTTESVERVENSYCKGNVEVK